MSEPVFGPSLGPKRETQIPPEARGATDAPTVAPGERPPPAPLPLPHRCFGGYELLAELGRGGMGVVFKARQIELDRIVALKMILGGSVSSPQDVQRFRTEAEAAARLQHAHIVQVFEVGQTDGQYYYSMEYIAGASLAQRLASGPLPGKEAARLLAAIARAVDHAHRHGILHRDLKPSNILVDSNDEPHITDFGLAKKMDVDSAQTRTGAVMGTPSYMSPEQAAGRVRELDERSDLYSLGSILYEMLTGRPPFVAETTLETLKQVIEREPAAPRSLNSQIHRDLETICLKCLQKDPADRYPSALALAQDLERYVQGEPIRARSINVLDLIGRTLEREQYLAEFHTWGTMLLIFAAIVCVESLVLFSLTIQGPPYPREWIAASRFVQFFLMALIFWRQRQQTLLPTTAAERQLWSIWIGYILACACVLLVQHGLKAAGASPNELAMLPPWSLLTGLAFFAMGSSYWGRCYLLGIGFFALGCLMPWRLEWAILGYGLMWSYALVTIGLYLRRLKPEGKTEHASADKTLPQTRAHVEK